MKILLHVNYCEKPGSLAELFMIAAKYGYDGVELRYEYVQGDMDQKEYQEKVSALKNEYPDLEITFGGTIDFCRGDSDEVKKETEKYLEFMQWAKTNCNTQVMNFFTGSLMHNEIPYHIFSVHGSALATKEDYQKSAAGLNILGSHAESLAMLIAVETHNAYLHDLAKPTKKLLDITGHQAVGANYDHGNIVLNKNGETIEEAFAVLDGKIYYAHLKNALYFGENVYMFTHLEQGAVNILDIFERLQTNLRSGMLALEYPAKGDGVIAAKRDMEYIKFIKDYIAQRPSNK
jgi:sugar phosphate isomerase/epimerase